MFVQESGVRQGTFSLSYVTSDADLEQSGLDFSRTVQWTRPATGATAAGAYVADTTWSTWLVYAPTNPATRFMTAVRTTFDPSATVDGAGAERVAGWNHMADGCYVMDTPAGRADAISWGNAPDMYGCRHVDRGGVRYDYADSVKPPGRHSFRGALYEVCVLGTGSQEDYESDPEMPDSDYTRYVVDNEDRSRAAWWNIEPREQGGRQTWPEHLFPMMNRVPATSGEPRGAQYAGSRECGVRKLGASGLVTERHYTRGVVSGGEGSYFYYVLRPVGEAPLLSPMSLDLGRIFAPVKIEAELSTDARVEVRVDGELVEDADARSGPLELGMEAWYEGLAVGRHDVVIYATNAAGYRCAAKRSFIKGFSDPGGGMDAGSRTRLLAFTRWGDQLGEVAATSAVHRQEVNGEDSLEFESRELYAKGDRIVWSDGGRWREHVVQSVDQVHDGAESVSCYCESSLIADLKLKDSPPVDMPSASPSALLSSLLEGTAWEVGAVDVDATAEFRAEAMSAYDALLQMCGAFGAEVSPSYEVDRLGVAARRVDFVSRVGADRNARFDYGRGVVGVERRVLDADVYTAVRAYGGEDPGVPGFVPEAFVADEEAKLTWGLPDGSGGVAHAVGVLVDESQCDAAGVELAARRFLKERSAPEVEYTTRMPFASLRGVCLGDTVRVADAEIAGELRIVARVGSIERDLLSKETSSATFGTVRTLVPDVLVRTLSTAIGAKDAADQARREATAVTDNPTFSGSVTISGDATGSLTFGEEGLLVNGEPLTGGSDMDGYVLEAELAEASNADIDALFA